MLGLRRVMWALRKLQIPAGNGLVLDVGSGGRPYPRSDVLLDRLTGSAHRCGEAMMMDGRAAVFGDANKMPFKDKAFDFVIASHILEHISEPEVFIKELQRVGRAGYIETPIAMFERLSPFDIHCLEIVCVEGKLRIHKKKEWLEDPFLGTQGILSKDPAWARFFHEAPDMFHNRYFWSDKIDYEILNPEVSCSWIERINCESEPGKEKDSYMHEQRGWREIGQAVLSRWYAARRAARLKNFDLTSILVCPACHGEVQKNDKTLLCPKCDIAYPLHPIPDFTPQR